MCTGMCESIARRPDFKVIPRFTFTNSDHGVSVVDCLSLHTVRDIMRIRPYSEVLRHQEDEPSQSGKLARATRFINCPLEMMSYNAFLLYFFC